MIELSKMLNLPDLPIQLKAVNKCLLETVSSSNKQIRESSTRIIKAGGKRLRPSLVIAVASINGQPISHNTIKLAAATELMHLGSLVHDDIIDEADTRWNIPTINSQEGPNQAIIIGDYLLASACALAASVGQEEAKLVSATIMKLCEGQYFELSEQFNPKRTEALYHKAIEGKTAALLSLSCLLGGVASDLDDQKLKSLESYGYNFGLAFQLVDDLMDLVSTEELYGKPVGNDIIEGVYTLPIILGLKGQESQLLKNLIASKKYDPRITQTLIQTGAIEQTMSKILEYNRLAKSSIEMFNSDVGLALQDLPNQYLDWATNKLIAKPYRQAVF